MPTLGEVATDKRPCGVLGKKVEGARFAPLPDGDCIAADSLRDADCLSRLLHCIALLGLVFDRGIIPWIGIAVKPFGRFFSDCRKSLLRIDLWPRRPRALQLPIPLSALACSLCFELKHANIAGLLP